QEEYVVNTLKMTTTKSLKAIPDLITELKNGNIDAVVTNEAVSLINVKKYDGIKMANTEVGKDVTEGMAAAIKKSDNNKDFIELLNKKIKELQDGKKIEEFLNEASTEAASN
ncbi:MAG: amino acid ABC transporter substrate-binding protein, partial [Clostridioides difficile]